MARCDVEALVFDLGGVIVGHDDAAMIAALAARCAGWTPQEVARLASEARWATGTPVEELHALLGAQAGYGGDAGAFLEDWCCHLSVDPAMLAYVEALATRHRVMIFSNTNAAHWDFFTAASDARLAHLEAHLSHELGRLKPDLEAYRRVAARAGLAPGALLFFDDKMENVEAARRAGFQAEHFTSQADLRAQLARRGLEAA